MGIERTQAATGTDASVWKPYPVYKDSGVEWLEKLPEGWKVQKLKHITKVNLSNVDKKTNDGEDTVKLCNYIDVYYNDYITPDLDFMEATASRDQIDKFALREGDVIITKDSESWEDIAVPAYVPADLKGVICGYHLAHVRPNYSDININGAYLFWSLCAPRLNHQFRVEAHGITRFGIGKYSIDNSLFIVPPNDEQNFISIYLVDRTRKIDSLIEKKQKMIELLKEERTATINQAVIKGLNPDVPMKDSGIEWLGEIPKHWEVKRLKYVSYINPIKSNIKSEKNSEEFVTFLPMEKVSEDGKIDTEIKKPIKDLMTGFTYFEENDVIVAKITPCFENGKGALIKNLGSKIGFGSTEFHVLRPREKIINKELLYYLTKSDFFMKLGESLMTGAAGQKRVPTSFLDNFVTCYSKELEEQNQIIKFIKNEMTKNDYIIAKIDKEIALLQEYRTSLISEVVTGKIDVREAI